MLITTLLVNARAMMSRQAARPLAMIRSMPSTAARAAGPAAAATLFCQRCSPPTRVAGKSFSSQWDKGDFRSDAEQKISKVPVIYVEEMTAVCNGGGGALGHPIEVQVTTTPRSTRTQASLAVLLIPCTACLPPQYIQLSTVPPNSVVECKYCGLRFCHKAHH